MAPTSSDRNGSTPLKGIRVLDLSRLLPGPFCSLILSELGADVIKVEDISEGDYLRHLPPMKNGMGGAFYALNRGKRSLAIDLKKPSGRELFLRLLPGFQVVIESFRPGVLEKLSLGYATLSSAHPEVILCSITGYGQTGPWKDRAGHDINYLGLSGVLSLGGSLEQPPMVPGIQLADLAGGALWAAIQILAALFGARDRNKGTHIDVSMTEGVMSFLLPWLGDLAFGGPPLRRGEGILNGGIAAYSSYLTADNKAVAVGALEPKFWQELCHTVGLSIGPAAVLASPEDQGSLRETLQRYFKSATRERWGETFERIDACVEPALEIEELESHPLHRERDMFFELDDPERGPISLLRLPLSSPPSDRPAPRQGEQTDEILLQEGISEAEILRLRAEGVLR
jgi:alpha-methylacyl-CoA racemase